MRLTLVDDAREAMVHARASVVASGTATVQAALIGNPFVVVYRVSGLTFALAKKLVEYPAEWPPLKDLSGNLAVGMVNLIAGKRVVPELLQESFSAANVANELAPLLMDGPAREKQMEALRRVRALLTVNEGSATAIDRVADAVVEELED